MSRRKHPVAQQFCEDCHVAFQVYTTIVKKIGFYCPLCGDSISVRDHTPLTGGKVVTRKHWKPEELAYLPLIKSRQYAAYQVAEIIGRTAMSVSKQYSRWEKLNQ